tara:strand:- start:7894 stop:8727 length:834 start_codon:yes stop_codon:yes gene_type:complete
MTGIQGVLNGNFNLLEKIKVSPLSRAYTFSDSVYEVIPFFNNNFIAFNDHIKRLKKSCDSLSININLEEVKLEILELFDRKDFFDGYIYYQISRGVDEIRSHMHDDNIRSERFGYIKDHNFETQHLSVMIFDDLRWGRCDIKTTSLLGNVQTMNEARKNGCDEIIMHKDNILTEAGASNIFFVIDNRVFTPSLSNNILPGITRQLLIEIMHENSIELSEGKFNISELKKSSCIWLCSSTKGLAPVCEIKNLDVELDVDNKVFLKCKNLFASRFLSRS